MTLEGTILLFRPILSIALLSFFSVSELRAAPSCPIPWAVNGSATDLSGTVTLTQNAPGGTGSAWDPAPLTLTSNFDMTFQVFLGTLDAGGSDGMMFVLQSAGLSALGDGGGFMGYATGPAVTGIQPSVAVEIDTYYNIELAEPTADHIGVNENAQRNHNGAAPVPASASSPNVEDGSEHTLRLVWDAAANTLSVHFDGVLRLTYTRDILNLIFSGNPVVYYGFTASNGGGTNVHYFYRTNPCPGAAPTSTATPSPTATATPTPTSTSSPNSTPTSASTPAPTEEFWLSRNLSRPALDNPALFVHISLFNPGNLDLTVYNTAGEMVKRLRRLEVTAPWTEDVPWDGTNEKGELAASGVYLIRFEWNLTVRYARIVLLR